MIVAAIPTPMRMSSNRNGTSTSNVPYVLLLTTFILVVVLPFLITDVEAFTFVTPSIRTPTSNPSSITSTALQCICIDCARVTDCAAYNFVEKKHLQPHINDKPTFTPQDGSPTIHVNIRTNRENKDEMGRLWSEHVEQTQKAEENSRVAKLDNNNDANNDSNSSNDTNEKRLIGEETYDLSVKTTYEYDVVACEDYVKDIGCWVRNMPEEIKLANPDFLPT